VNRDEDNGGFRWRPTLHSRINETDVARGRSGVEQVECTRTTLRI